MSASLTPDKAARLLGCARDTLMRGWPIWHRERGFPPPLDVGTRGTRHLRFDHDALVRWRESGGLSRPPSALPPPVDWAIIAARRGAALDDGRDPDLIPELNPGG